MSAVRAFPVCGAWLAGGEEYPAVAGDGVAGGAGLVDDGEVVRGHRRRRRQARHHPGRLLHRQRARPRQLPHLRLQLGPALRPPAERRQQERPSPRSSAGSPTPGRPTPPPSATSPCPPPSSSSPPPPSPASPAPPGNRSPADRRQSDARSRPSPAPGAFPGRPCWTSPSAPRHPGRTARDRPTASSWAGKACYTAAPTPQASSRPGWSSSPSPTPVGGQSAAVTSPPRSLFAFPGRHIRSARISPAGLPDDDSVSPVSPPTAIHLPATRDPQPRAAARLVLGGVFLLRPGDGYAITVTLGGTPAPDSAPVRARLGKITTVPNPGSAHRRTA